MQPRSSRSHYALLVLLLNCALWLAIAGVLLALGGLLLPDCHWEHVRSGGATLGSAGMATALALDLLLTPTD